MKGRNTTKKRINESKLIYGVFLFLLAILFISYAYIAISPSVLGINIQEFAKTRNTYATTLKAKRGTIYDKDGNILALNVYSYTVIAYLDPSRTTDMDYPHHVIDVDMTAEKLSPILDMSVEVLTDLMSQEGLYQVELGPGGRNITELKKEAIEILNLPGIDFIESAKRFYPNGDFASYAIGYAKANEYQNEKGKTIEIIDGELGIEARYDEELKGTDGFLSYQQDVHGYKIPETKEEKVEAINGEDIYLTIDSSIQRFVEEAMDNAEKNYKFEWLQIHIMDAKTGDILATSTSPSFDPNIRNIINYENNLTSIVIEPGSVMKTFTYMCAMEKGKYDGSKTYMSGGIEVGDSYISDWNRVGWGNITYDIGYVKSSNVAITNILLNEKFIDKNDLKLCLQNYGFGEKTNVELTREAKGDLDFNYPVEVAAAGYGQGINVTPIQIMQGYSILANNGYMLKPHIISKIVDSNNNKVLYQRKVEKSEQLVSEKTITKMHELMDLVVNDDGGSGNGYSLKKYGIGLMGKTGTAQIFENGSYLYNQYIRSFAGMFPKEDPQIVIYAAVKKVSPDGSEILEESLSSIIQNIARYYSMYSEKVDKSLNSYLLSDYTSKNIDITSSIQKLKLKPIIIGDGSYIIKQYPAKNTSILEGEKVFLLTNSSTYKMPDMTNWSRTDVISYFNLIGAKYKIEGNGYVRLQSLSPNKDININEEITITLASKY